MRTSIILPLVYLCIVILSDPALAQSPNAAGSSTFSSFMFTRVQLVDPATDTGNSQGASWVDYDGDGDLDLFVVNNDQTGNLLYQNDGAGHLSRVASGLLATAQIPARGVCWADYDNDDDLDVFVSGPNSTLYINDGSGNFTAADPASTFGTTDLRGWACSWADFDLDGFVDLIVTHPKGFVGNPPIPNLFFHNRGDGTMEQITDSPVTADTATFTVATWSDYDMDGDPDLFIGTGPANGTLGPDYLFRNMLAETGTANFVRITDGPLATKNRDGQVINWIDYDNDGDWDVFVTNWGGTRGGVADELYRNDSGTLVPVAVENLTGTSVSLASDWGDFDNDGDLDVYVSDGNANRPSRLFENNGDGTFTSIFTGQITSDLGNCWSAVSGDFDDDGDLDLFVANAMNRTVNFLYRNDLAPGNHWLKVKTVGTASNRAGIGAILRARAVIGGVPTWMMRDVSSQNSFDGHNDLTVHFGLGDATSVDSLLVIWPSGARDLYQNIPVDQDMIATEGESPTSIAVEEAELPGPAELLSNYPNPFANDTRFVYSLSSVASVDLSVYDLLGRLVAVPVAGVRSPGRHEVLFRAADLPSGPYLYRLKVGDRTYERRMAVVR